MYVAFSLNLLDLIQEEILTQSLAILDGVPRTTTPAISMSGALDA